jgi:hypothetical protein
MMPSRKVTLAAAVILASGLCLQARLAGASDPTRARYTDDPNLVFWFVHISDSHIDSLLADYEQDNLRWALTTGVDVVGPVFVVNTGDLVDGTDGINYLASPVDAEWDEYRGIVDGAGMTDDFYYDLIGNHDAYGDENAVHYLTRSVQGVAQGTTQPSWRIDLPFGSYAFVAVATVCNDWLPWWNDNMEITDEEYAEITANLEANADTNLTLTMGHHDYIVSKAGVEVIGGARLEDLFASHGVAYYFHGHEHDLRTRVTDADVVIRRISALGQTTVDNFCVTAVDADGVSETCMPAQGSWPLIVVTAPVDAKLGPGDDVDNPYAPSVPVTCEEAPVRVLVFDEGEVSAVAFWWDTGLTGGLHESDVIPGQWLGTFDATQLNPGVHVLSVQAIGSETHETAVQVLFEDRTCDISGPPADEGAEEAAESPDEAAPEAVDPRPEAPEDAATEVPADTTSEAGEDASDEEEEIPSAGGGGGCGC